MIPTAANPRDYYKMIKEQIKEYPNSLPNFIRKDVPESYLLVNGSAKHGMEIFNSTCTVYGNFCNDKNSWIGMLNKFYPHVRGNYNTYKTKYYPKLTWKDFYFKVVNSPKIMQTGFN